MEISIWGFLTWCGELKSENSTRRCGAKSNILFMFSIFLFRLCYCQNMCYCKCLMNVENECRKRKRKRRKFDDGSTRCFCLPALVFFLSLALSDSLADVLAAESAATVDCCCCRVAQEFRNRLICFLQDTNELAGQGSVSCGDVEARRFATISDSSGSSNAMNVVLWRQQERLKWFQMIFSNTDLTWMFVGRS